MHEILTILAAVFWYTVFFLVPGGVFSLVLHYLLSLPSRRRDRALFFLDLMETVVSRGQPVEPAILSAAENHDAAIGVGFFMVAAQIEGGARLGEALEKVPGFLPPQVNAMIRAGEKLGDLRKVLPACREVLRVAPDTVRTTMHYMVAILVLFAPGAIMVITLLTSMVVPKFKEIFAATGTQLWPVAKFVFALNDSGVLTGIEAVLLLMLVGATAFYIGGPRAVRWFQYDRAPVVDWITWRIPWKHKQLLRAFSAMLAVLLDGGVPEAEAVRLAGESTANEICRRRAGRVMAAMQEGAALTEAIRTFDNTGEFHWRMTNAAHAHGGFLDALRGWHAALDARAFQQEETATHMFTSGLVILNGVIVGLVAVGMFGLLVMLLRATIATT